MASGVNMSEECMAAYAQVKTEHKAKFVFFKLSDNLKEIVVDKIGPETATYEEFVAEIKQLPKEACRYAVYDFEWDTADGGKRKKIIFFTWVPETANVKSKMLYASSKDSISKKFEGIGHNVQGTDFSEIDREVVMSGLSKIK